MSFGPTVEIMKFYAMYKKGLTMSNINKTKLIMVIELSGVQFGMKFKIGRSAPHKFDLKSQVWFQTKIARHQAQLPLYYSYF